MTQEARNRIRYKFWLALFNLPYINNTQARKTLSGLHCNIYDVLLFLLSLLSGKQAVQLRTFNNKEDLFRYNKRYNKEFCSERAVFHGLGCFLCKSD
jgi:hypothetical protein